MEQEPPQETGHSKEIFQLSPISAPSIALSWPQGSKLQLPSRVPKQSKRPAKQIPMSLLPQPPIALADPHQYTRLVGAVGLLAIANENGQLRHGVGYLVHDYIALTCAHLLKGAKQVHFVYFEEDNLGCWFKASSWKPLTQMEEGDRDVALVFLEDENAQKKCRSGNNYLAVGALRQQEDPLQADGFVYYSNTHAWRLIEEEFQKLSADEHTILDGSPLFHHNKQKCCIQIFGVYSSETRRPVFFTEQILNQLVAMSQSKPLISAVCQEKFRDPPTSSEQIAKGINSLFLVPNISQLVLNNLLLGTQGVKLISTGQWPELRVLRLWGCGLGDQALFELIRAYLPRLTELYLAGNYLGVESSLLLCRSHWPWIRIFSIGDSPTLATRCRLELLIRTNWPEVEPLNQVIVGNLQLRNRPAALEDALKLRAGIFFSRQVRRMD